MSGDGFEGADAVWPGTESASSVVHLAARVHVMQDSAADPLSAFRVANVDGTLRIAKAAHARGVRRFVFVSSIKAVGEADRGHALREDDVAAPADPYGQSKCEAEMALRRFGSESGLEVVIVRPPLVYGPQVRANFLALIRAIDKGIPIPMGTVPAVRSMIYVGNIADALAQSALDDRAAGGCFHVADDESLTVEDLVRAIARHLRRPARMIRIPAVCLRVAGSLTGRMRQVDRLTASLKVDSSRIRTTLGWRPPYTLDEGLAETIRWYRSSHR
jgi:nucleoside-diphosphate-sugar epimerase